MSCRTFCFLPCVLAVAMAPPVLADTLWVPAEKAQQLSPTMYLGGKLGLQEEGYIGDFLAPTVVSDPNKPDGESYAQFSVTVSQAGTYYVWARVRYPMGGGDSFGFSLVDQGKAGPVLALGDGQPADRNWHWDSQADGPGGAAGSGRLKVVLRAGKATFRITARGARASVFYPHAWRWAEAAFNPHLNFLCITSDPSYVPSDADAVRASGASLTRSAPAPHALPLGLKPLSPAEFQANERQPIPDWMRCPRWYTKDSWRQELATRAPGDIEKLVRQVAACHGNVLRISVLLGGQAFYQSRVAPHMPGLGKLDYLREAMDAGHRYGVKIVTYLWPWGMCVDHPAYRDCVIRDTVGGIPARADYTLCDFDTQIGFVCPNTPAFRKFYRDVLTEIFTEYKPDGMYVDGLTPNFCFCQHCRAKYRQMFDAEMPVEKIAKFYWPVTYWGALTSAPYLIGDPHDPDAHRFTAMVGRSQLEITRLFTETVKHCKPDAATTYHSYPKANNIQYYDGTLTEIYPSTPWVHTAWNFGEVANYSNVFPVPVMSNVYPHDHCVAPESRCKALQALANGTYPNYWSTLEMAPVFGYMERNAEYFDFALTRPNKFITLARDFRFDPASKATPTPAGVRYAQDRFLAPAVGAYSAIVRSGLTLSTIHRVSLERQLSGVRVLVLANAGLLSDRQVRAIREFVRRGGGLIATHETSLYDENGSHRGDFALADLFGAHYLAVQPAAQRNIRSAKSHPLTAALGRADLVHDQPFVAVRPDKAEVLANLPGAQPSEADSPAILVHSFGKGRVVYMPGLPDSLQCVTLTPWVERLYAAAIRWAGAEEPPAVIHAAAMVGGSLFDQPQRRILHLLNHNRDSKYYGAELTPLENVVIDFAVPAGRQVQRIHTLWNSADVRFTQENGRAKVTLPKLEEYEALALEFQ